MSPVISVSPKKSIGLWDLIFKLMTDIETLDFKTQGPIFKRGSWRLLDTCIAYKSMYPHLHVLGIDLLAS